LNDDSNPVGAVHLGLVYAADAAGRPVAIRETHKLSGEFVAMAAVANVADKLETWSALLFDFLSGR
jgi:predicted NUDIX family phosphoesterase